MLWCNNIFPFFLFLGFSSMSNEADVDDLLNIMKDAVHCKKNKNVDILHLASQICRRMHGKNYCVFFLNFFLICFWFKKKKRKKKRIPILF